MTIWICQFRTPSLFDAVSMSKTAMAALNRIYDLDSNLVASSRLCPQSSTQVIFCILLCEIHLVHMQNWYRDMCCTCKKHFPNWFVIVFFDESSSHAEAQYQVIEQSRRASKVTSVDIAVSPLNNTTTTQEEVIGNGHNKTSLNTLLSVEYSWNYAPPSCGWCW